MGHALPGTVRERSDIGALRLGMALQYALLPGTIVLCDYDMGGFRPPEMVKLRPAVIVSPRLRHRDGLCAVVPLSGSVDDARPLDYVVRFDLDQPLPHPFPQQVWWAKCDLIATVGFRRLDMFRTERDQTGKRRYLQPRLPPADLGRVRAGVLFGLGLGSLTEGADLSK